MENIRTHSVEKLPNDTIYINSGTVGYLAPEVLCKVNHNFSIDYYSVGIKTYELMFSHRPYIGKNKHEVKQLILLKPKENMRIFLLVFLITFLTL